MTTPSFMPAALQLPLARCGGKVSAWLSVTALVIGVEQALRWQR